MYDEILATRVAEQTAITDACVTAARCMAMMKDGYSNAEFLLAMAQVMSEFVEDGMRERLVAEGLGGSELYKTLRVFPFVYRKDIEMSNYVKNVYGFHTHGEIQEMFTEMKNPPRIKIRRSGSILKGHILCGCVVHMKPYGFFVDVGRGQTQKGGGPYDSVQDSPFWQALYEWALDVIHVDTKGKKYKVTQRETELPTLREWKPKGKSRLMPSFETVEYEGKRGEKELETTGVNSWMKALRAEEKRVLPKRGVQSEESGGGHTYRPRGEVGRTEQQPKADWNEQFVDLVTAIYNKINEFGYEGNGFILDTLKEMHGRGILDYYFSAYTNDMIKEGVKFNAHAIVAQKGGHRVIRKGKTQIKVTSS
jgi:hypothetical protein